MQKIIQFIIFFSGFIEMAYCHPSIVDTDNYKVELDSNEIWGVFDKIIWKDVEIGGVKEIVDTVSKKSLFKSFCIYEPNYVYTDTSYADALKNMEENTPKEFFMDVWHYESDEWTRLNDYRNGWVLSIPKSKIWGGGYSNTNMFGTDLAKYDPSKKNTSPNAFQIHTFISGQKRIVMYMGMEEKKNPSMKDEDYIKEFPVYKSLKSDAVPRDTLINNEKFKCLEFYGDYNFMEFKIIGRSVENKWLYYYIVYLGNQEKQKLEGVLNEIINNSIIKN